MNINMAANQTDVVILYQDHDAIAGIIDPIIGLNISFKSLLANNHTLDLLEGLKPKVLLFAFNHIAAAIQYYVHYLEKLQNQHSHHYVVLLVTNKEAKQAFFTCESGLFDNYSIINPLNDHYRLPLIIMNSLSLVNERRNDGILQLMQEGDDELAICIDRGIELKQSLLKNIEKYQGELLSHEQLAASPEIKNIIKNVTEDIFSQLHQDLEQHMGGLIHNLLDVKKLHTVVNNKFKENLYTEKNLHSLNEKIENLVDLADITEENSITEQVGVVQKLLIGDKSELFTQVIADIFIEEKFQVFTAKDGKEVIEKATLIQPDAIIISYNLPLLNGLEVTKKLRKLSCCQNIPIIAFSSNTDKHLIKKWIPLGLNAYLVKPSSNDTIRSTVIYELNRPAVVLKSKHNGKSASIQWLPEYSVGDDVMDKHHQILFDVINEYFQIDSNDTAAVLDIFTKLSDYVEFHFKAEETLLRDKKYPNLEQHIGYHEVFLKKLSLIKSKLHQKDPDLADKIGMFLYKWLTKHILGADMAYKRFVEKKP